LGGDVEGHDGICPGAIGGRSTDDGGLPSGNVDPELGAEVTEKLLPAPSDTVGEVKFTVAPPAPVASTVISGGWDAVQSRRPGKKFRGVVTSALVARRDKLNGADPGRSDGDRVAPDSAFAPYW